MKIVKPISEEKKAELRLELAVQKQRFIDASRRGMNAVRTDLSVSNWLQAYPREAAMLIILGGFITARLIQSRRQQGTTRYPKVA